MNDDTFKNLEDEIRLSVKAKSVLESEPFKIAFGRLEQALLEAMRSAGTEDKTRNRLLDKFQVLHEIRDTLQSMVDTGMMAETQLKERTIFQRVKDFVAN